MLNTYNVMMYGLERRDKKNITINNLIKEKNKLK